MLRFLGSVALVTLMLAIARQLAEKPVLSAYSDAWAKPFSKHGQVEETFQNPNPADAHLETPTDPYALLADTLAVKKTAGQFTAESCYDADFLAQSNKTGNLLQRTNNFRHLGPDSCSTPLTELVNSFYTHS